MRFKLVPLLLLLTACRAMLPVTGAHPVMVFDEGEHMGLLMLTDDFPIEFHTQTGLATPLEQPKFVEIGFSERQWITGQDRSLAHLLRLMVVDGEGVIVIRYHQSDTGPVFGETVSRMTLSEDQIERLTKEMLLWMELGGTVDVDPRGNPRYLVRSTQPYSLLTNNCRDFAQEMSSVATHTGRGN